MKTAIITGGARGIGREVSKLFSKRGYNVLINYNASQEAAESLSAELGKTPHIIYKADITDSSAVNKMVDAAHKQFGGVDILVNNAGIAEQSLFCDITDSAWKHMLDVNLNGAFYASRAAAKYMIAQKSGSIVNVSSVWGIVGGSCEVHYSASKAALIGMTKALAKELGPSGIRVNAVAPGITETDMMFELTNEERKTLVDETPLGRFASPAEIAEAIVFLSESEFITGQVLSPNGGFTIY
ncbi:MAG: 3-oxoacyl-ACP reductase FabG [Clostridia bacterium]|nr:3-oxoacyl-ACP reductase FabG [Clostridia bacterium]